MPDLRKVLDGLEHCARMKPCDKCPYGAECKRAPEHNAVMADALALLRDQNSKIIELKQERQRLRGYALELMNDPNRVKVVRCGNCRFWKANNAEEGDSSGTCMNGYSPAETTDMNWFCADGERE